MFSLNRVSAFYVIHNVNRRYLIVMSRAWIYIMLLEPINVVGSKHERGHN